MKRNEIVTNTEQTHPRNANYEPHEIEPRWQHIWEKQGIYTTDLKSDGLRYYFLTMYPYPSGDLHVGHWYAFTPADAAARYRRMKGNHVFFPIGFDAFGLPAENAAIKHNIHPASWTYKNISDMVNQFKAMGTMCDWSKMIVTCDSKYYKWNQWLFLQLYEKGLAYKKLSPVDWCPSCNTTLAREQVVGEARLCERCDAPVHKKNLSQWYLKITDYAEELLYFGDLDWPDKIKLMQMNWIGRSEGVEITFELEAGGGLTVFTTRPDTLWGATFLTLAPEHPLVDRLVTPKREKALRNYIERSSRMSEIDRQAAERTKTGEFTGAYAVNPANRKRLPVWVADYVLLSYGTGAIMGVPAHDERDFDFARKFGLDIVPVIQPEGAVLDAGAMSEAYTGEGRMVNSGVFDGTHTNGTGDSEGVRKVSKWLKQTGKGEKVVRYRLRDWLISRQRYWGTPIPIVYCDKCGIVPVPVEALPVTLPKEIEFAPTGESPLKSYETFLKTCCPNCGSPAKRETDTMDTFVDSSWYWFRYLSPNLEAAPFDKALADRWIPVKQYTGGAEHATMHLLYARFFTKVMRDLALTDVDEPFTSLRNQGIILGEDGRRMSKSRGNVVNPDHLVSEYGADTVRAYLMFIGPWDAGGPWNSSGIEGIRRFLNRTWSLLVGPADKETPASEHTLSKLKYAVHTAIKKVSDNMEEFRFNTAIAELMILVNYMAKIKSLPIQLTDEWREGAEALVKLLAPIAPHIAEELWQQLDGESSVHLQSWPEFDPTALVRNNVTLAVQVNGKRRDEVTISKDAGKEVILDAAKAAPNVARHIKGATIIREIVVPGRLVNIVISEDHSE